MSILWILYYFLKKLNDSDSVLKPKGFIYSLVYIKSGVWESGVIMLNDSNNFFLSNFKNMKSFHFFNLSVGMQN
jgi:hypothetical protein